MICLHENLLISFANYYIMRYNKDTPPIRGVEGEKYYDKQRI